MTHKPKLITSEYLMDYFKIDASEAEHLLSCLECIVYKSDEHIVTVGEPADGLFFIDEGQATVLNKDGEAVNEMSAGQLFGEYAILAGETRMTTVKAHGHVIAYKLGNNDFIELVGRHPEIAGRLLKQVYSQVSNKHTRIQHLTRNYRGVMWSPETTQDHNLTSILLTYGCTIALFIAVLFMAPAITEKPVWWLCLPLVFLLVFTLRTKRTVEGMLLTVILLSCMLHPENFIYGFGQMLVEGIGNPDTSSTIVIMGMVESVAALLAAAGVATAFKKLAEKKVTNKKNSFLAMLLIMIAVCLDESLNVITAGYCMNTRMDEYKIPREERAVLGSFSMAICSLIPFSLWSAYISGWLDMYLINGGNVFLKAIPYNLAGVFASIFAIGLILGLLPKSRSIKEAYTRIQNGGTLWPIGSEKFFDNNTDEVVGKPMNLLLPMLVWAVSSVGFGMLENRGEFAMDAISGLFVTLIFMFVLYVSQNLMSPKMFFETLASGIGNALMPILLLVFAERISASLEVLGFNLFLESYIPKLVGGNLALIPVILFIIFTLIGLGIGSCWGMYGLSIPISIYLSVRLGLNVPLCISAGLAAGIVGEALCPYLNDTSSCVVALGCEPKTYRKLRYQYWIPLTVLCLVGYTVLGVLFI